MKRKTKWELEMEMAKKLAILNIHDRAFNMTGIPRLIKYME